MWFLGDRCQRECAWTLESDSECNSSLLGCPKALIPLGTQTVWCDKKKKKILNTEKVLHSVLFFFFVVFLKEDSQE